jgi:phosphatidate cytidylyltransferase
MLKRILTAIVAIAIFLPILIWSDTVIFAIAMGILCAIACAEMLRCMELLRLYPISLPMIALGAALPVLPYWLERSTLEHIGVMSLVVAALYLFTVMTFSRGKITLQSVGNAYLTGFYIIAAFCAMSALRYRTAAGEYVYLICFIGAWVTDTFAYFTGMLFGKHKLIPDVSPKKTVEGAVGGVVFCVLAFVGFGLLYNNLWVIEGGGKLPLWIMAVMGVLVSIVSQIGDLSLSLLKRKYGIKDFGKIFPGHGGVMDRFDSVLAVSIMLLVCFTALSVLGL